MFIPSEFRLWSFELSNGPLLIEKKQASIAVDQMKVNEGKDESVNVNSSLGWSDDATNAEILMSHIIFDADV